jgi:hypothetical protein
MSLLYLYETLDEVFHHATIVDWWKDVKHTSEVIPISSSSTTIPCTMRGNTIEALHDPAAEACIIFEYLMDSLVGNKPLTLIDKYLRSPSRLLFECRGITRDVPITIDKIEVHLDFHIYNIIDFDLLLGYPLEKLLYKNVSLGSLDEKLRKTASATTTSCLENPMAKPHPKQNPLIRMMHVSPFVSSKPVLFEDAKSAAPEEDDLEEILHLSDDE